MSDPGRRFALLLWLTWPSALGAQEAGAWQDSAQRLVVALQAIRDSLLEGDSTVREVARREDLVIGASDHLRAAAAAALEQLVEVRRRWFGGPGAVPSPDGFRIVLRVAPRMPGSGGDGSAVVLSGLPDTGAAPRAERPSSRAGLAQNLIDTYGEMMSASLGPALRNWLQLNPPLSLPDRERGYLIMYTIVTGTGKAQRRCVSGSLADCAYALGLGSPAVAEPGGAYAAFVRTDLLLTALELGGSEAWHRLRAAASDSTIIALATAAGMPRDSLLARWRSRTLALRPTRGPLRATAALLAAGWITVLLVGTLAGARSRWM